MQNVNKIFITYQLLFSHLRTCLAYTKKVGKIIKVQELKNFKFKKCNK